MPINNNLYKSWFDTPFYHILYKNRDYKEAEIFTRKLMDFIRLPLKSKILDLACGKGRHSINLNKMGYDVTGVDLSVKNIKNASKYESENLKFKIHDMRKPFGQKFDLVVNLFTSFGYFDDFKDNLKTLDIIVYRKHLPYLELPLPGFQRFHLSKPYKTILSLGLISHFPSVL